MFTLHTFGFSLGEVLFADGLVCCFIPPVRLFAVTPLGVTFVTVYVIAIGSYGVSRHLEFIGHGLNKLGVCMPVIVTMFFKNQVTELVEGIKHTVLFTIATLVLFGHRDGMV